MSTTKEAAVPEMTAEEEAAHEAAVASAEQAMRDAGEPTHTDVIEDFFGMTVEHTVWLQKDKQFVTHREMSEGQRREYLNSINRDVTIAHATRDMKMRMAPGDERHALLKTAIIGWQVYREGNPLPFSKKNLQDFLEAAPPKIIDMIEKDVRLANPWLMQEMSLEDIDKEIESLQELRAKKVEEEAGNA